MFWAGLSTYLIIEQASMRSINTRGGLTRGKGMTDNQRLVWGSCPCQYVQASMRSSNSLAVSHMKPVTCTRISAARQSRNISDDLDLIDYLNERDPFIQIFNIANSMTGQQKVNIEKAR